MPEATGYYFVNGFYNFVFSLLFVNPLNGELTGVVNGIPYSAAASSLIQRNDSSYILTRFDENQNYIKQNLQFLLFQFPISLRWEEQAGRKSINMRLLNLSKPVLTERK